MNVGDKVIVNFHQIVCNWNLLTRATNQQQMDLKFATFKGIRIAKIFEI